MDLVLDANILFSALIRQDTTFNLILHEDIHLYAPEFILVELAKYKELILQKTDRSAEEFDAVLAVLCKYIQFVPMEDFVTFLNEAERISPDPKDVAYLVGLEDENTHLDKRQGFENKAGFCESYFN
ncbi:MAG: PIN domain-containing protein [Nanoarchaeota archaeon]